MPAGVALVAALAGLWACGSADDRGERHDSAARPFTVQTTFPGLAAPTGEPALPGLLTASPAPGTVARLAGPFDDRLRLTSLDLTDRAVSGSVSVTSDVSDVLELQVLAGFYDGTGRLLGTARFTHHLDEDTAPQHSGPPSETEIFRIRVPEALRGRVASAAVGVPVLVNE